MNTYAHKPMPYGAKLRKLYENQYIVPYATRMEMVEVAESRRKNAERELIELIDNAGCWLD